MLFYSKSDIIGVLIQFEYHQTIPLSIAINEQSLSNSLTTTKKFY